MTAFLTLGRYFFQRYLTSVIATFVASSFFIYLIDMIELSRRSVSDNFSAGELALISALRVPAFVQQAFPFIILFSSVFTLLSLNRRLELVIARAAGVSIWQILAPFLAGSFLVGIAVTGAYNPLAAWALRTSEAIQAEATGQGLATERTDRIPWFRQSAEGIVSVIGASSVTRGGIELNGVTAFILDDNGVARERIDATKATLVDNAWVLSDATVAKVGYAPERQDTLRLPTRLRPEYVEQQLADPETIPIWELYSKIDVAQNLGYNVNAFSMQYNTLIAMPALFLAMTLVAATVSVRFARMGQSARTIVSGIIAGFALYVVTFLAKALGSNAVVPPVVAAWFPAVAAGLFGITILLHQEDG
ncbi:LPS export ABC transporter permease LptG [Consotaella salsifontis]|uniref:Lipopolysaccharide export system permease protein n=1 Tax=Consotaella salsifontis TaxID=1365950 RepID=A0A1T4SKH9_9HYPH|nr:LPS export ABC transporter permease LptG [Consotaella salsifontis]SKA28794.1 lipopolysaccharide export system permease protein [Consotaella salsifontis]